MDARGARRGHGAPAGGQGAAQGDRSDEELLARVASGDTEALAIVYDRHASCLLGLAVRLLGDRSDAEDLVHDVFLEVGQRAASYDARRAPVRSWLFLRVRSRGIDRLRSLQAARRALHGREPAPDEPLPEPAAGLAFAPDRKRAVELLDTLSREQRRVLELAYFAGFSYREIGEVCGIPVSTAKARAAAAIAALRRRLRVGAGDGADTDARKGAGS